MTHKLTLALLVLAGTAALHASPFAYTSQNYLYKADIGNSTSTYIGVYSPAIQMLGLDINPLTGTLYGVSMDQGSTSTLYTINPNTAAYASTGIAFTGSARDITFDDAGNLYVVQGFGNVLRIDVNAGTVSNIGGTVFLGSGIAWHNGQLIVLGDAVPNTGFLGYYSVNPNNGASSLLSSYSGPQFPEGMDSLNGVLYLANGTNDNFFSVELGTGALTYVGAGGSGTGRTIALIDDGVPEPGTLGTVGVALIAASAAARRRLRRA